MCGILAVFGAVDDSILPQADEAAARLAHRGPDGGGVHVQPGVGALLHRRLAIMDPGAGHQPLFGRDGAAVVHNGEIYNHELLRRELSEQGRRCETGSDSEVIAHLYELHAELCVHLLDGVFAFAAVSEHDWMVARDPIGVKPLYYGGDARGYLWFASELKALADRCEWYKVFPPGHVYTRRGGLRRWYQRPWLDGQPEYRREVAGLRERFEAAIDKRLMSDVPLGVLLSGGLDSSLVAALAARLARRRDPGARLMSFAIGVDGDSPDLRAAREVAAFIGTDHHEVRLDVEQGVAALRDIVWHVESYDVPTVRASIPMFFLSRYIRDRGVKVVLSGEGSDEMFGGYLYFYFADGPESFQRETVERVRNLHLSDVLRADKSTMAHGVEARVPFLDLDFLDLVMTIDPVFKRPLPPEPGRGGRMEKALLRTAFADPADPLLPAPVLWRQKEQFSDGVGYGWVDRLKAHAESVVGDAEFAAAARRFPYETPTSKEAFLYRAIFCDIFPGEHAERCVTRWVPRWQTDCDSSGRANPMHARSYRQVSR
jgi:asparagine synthase (glutamine-hydrolysing)